LTTLSNNENYSHSHIELQVGQYLQRNNNNRSLATNPILLFLLDILPINIEAIKYLSLADRMDL